MTQGRDRDGRSRSGARVEGLHKAGGATRQAGYLAGQGLRMREKVDTGHGMSYAP